MQVETYRQKAMRYLGLAAEAERMAAHPHVDPAKLAKMHRAQAARYFRMEAAQRLRQRAGDPA